jgi:hypothetical protein
MDELITKITINNAETISSLDGYLISEMKPHWNEYIRIIKKTVKEYFEGIPNEVMDELINTVLIEELEKNNFVQHNLVSSGIESNTKILINSLKSKKSDRELCVRNYEGATHIIYATSGMDEALHIILSNFISNFYNKLSAYLKSQIKDADAVRDGMLNIRFEIGKELRPVFEREGTAYTKYLSSILIDNARNMRRIVYLTPYTIPKTMAEVLDGCLTKIIASGYRVKGRNGEFYAQKGNEEYKLILDGEKIYLEGTEEVFTGVDMEKKSIKGQGRK